MIVKTGCGTDEALYYTLHSTSCGCVRDTGARRAGNCEQSVGGELPHGRSSTLQSSRLLVIGNSFLFANTDQETEMFIKNQLFSPDAEGAIVQRSSVCWVARVAELGPGTSEIYVDQRKLINSFPLNIADTTVANKNLLRYRSC